MKLRTLILNALCLPLASTLFLSCDKVSKTVTIESDSVSTESAPAAADRAKNDHDPIPSTTPEGSRMDSSSNAYIILDGSGSMMGEPIAEAKNAVAAFVKGAPEALNIGLYVFDQHHPSGAEVVPLGKGPQQRGDLQKAIGQVRAGGSTPLGSALRNGTDALIKRFQWQLRYGDIRLIVVTDGAASDAGVFHQSITHARSHHVPIYTIGFRMRSSHPLRHYSEAYLTAQDESELLNAMQQTLAELDDDAEL